MLRRLSSVLAIPLIAAFLFGCEDADEAQERTASEFFQAHKQEFVQAQKEIAEYLIKELSSVSDVTFTKTGRGMLVVSTNRKITGMAYCTYFYLWDLGEYDKHMQFYAKVYRPGKMADDIYFSRVRCEKRKFREF